MVYCGGHATCFRDLANPELLKVFTWRYAKSNESVNNVIWSRVPKKTFVQLEVLSLEVVLVQAMECLEAEAVTSKYYCLEKQGSWKEKDLKRKKDDELLKNADNLEYGAKMFN
ncbi:hypothetical protein TNCV_193201 [Trichonephila clavipes]|nr:hypothetical protein TNCV_193201 [Trichonephila clavipes]